MTPLYLACQFEAWDSALLLLNMNADVNKAARWHEEVRTPLYMAAVGNSTAVCRSLLARGARIDLGEHHLIFHLLSSALSSQLSFG